MYNEWFLYIDYCFSQPLSEKLCFAVDGDYYRDSHLAVVQRVRDWYTGMLS